jgi:YegS/Rv2252/BmrU family lipid kinase
MSIVAIVNPISGARANPSAAAERVEVLRAEAARRGVAIDVHLTTRAGHARDLAAAGASAGASLLVVWGGDGTLNEAGSALIGTGTTLGLIPAGSGNGLAAALELPRDPRQAIAAAFDGPTRSIDAGTIAGRPFFNVAGIGFDAHIARLFNQQPIGRRGPWPYIVIGVREGCRYRAVQYDLQLDGERRSVRALLIVFANGREYGLGARIAPEARLDDGWLNATIVEDRAVPVRFWHARHLARGTAHLAPCVIAQTVRRATVDAGEEPIEYHVDGEVATTTGPVEVAIIPGALRVRVPQ